MDESLDLTRYTSTAAVDVVPSALATTYVVIAIGVFIALMLVSAWATLRLHITQPPRPWELTQFPPAVRALAFLGILGLMLVQLVALAGIYVQTRVVHESTADYFAYLSVARLVGTSHAHLFGYTFLYGAIGFIATLATARPSTKALIIAALMWSGPFDVASWWGIKMIGARFEWLSIATAIASTVASLVTVFITWHSVRKEAS